MKILKSYLFYSNLTIYIVLFGLTAAVPQWYNSTDGRQYLIEGEQKYNWFRAFHECARHNLQLVEIDSQQKNQALIDVLNAIFGNSHNLWIGANDEYNRDINFNRPFYWSSSGKPLKFTYWADKNPDNDIHEEHCVHMWDKGPEYKWNDHHCDTFRFGFICEDHHLLAAIRKTVSEKHKKIAESTMKLFEKLHMFQKEQTEKLEDSLMEIEKRETELKDLLQNMHTSMIFTQDMAQHQREVYSAVDDKSKVIRNLSMDLRSASEVMTKKFATEVEAAKTVFNGILRC